MTPAMLIDHARRLCADPDSRHAFWATRAATLLTRQAMEAWLDEYWEATAPAVRAIPSARARFLLLEGRLSPLARARAYATWWRLSEACHHYSHDLPPSPLDVQAWVEEAAAFAAELQAAARRDR